MKFFTVCELAREFGKSENTIRGYERSGQLAAIRVGNGMRLFPEESVDTFRKKFADANREKKRRGHGRMSDR